MHLALMHGWLRCRAHVGMSHKERMMFRKAGDILRNSYHLPDMRRATAVNECAGREHRLTVLSHDDTRQRGRGESKCSYGELYG